MCSTTRLNPCNNGATGAEVANAAAISVQSRAAMCDVPLRVFHFVDTRAVSSLAQLSVTWI